MTRPGCPQDASLCSWRAWTVAASLLVALWLATFWPVVVGHRNLMGYDRLDPRLTGAPMDLAPKGGIRWPARGDTSLHMIFLPEKAFLSSELHRGTYPLWNPRIGCGQPVASDPQYQPFSPFFWPYLARPSAWMLSLGIALVALFGMVGFSLYFRELGWSLPAVLAGGALLAWNPLTTQMLVLSSAWAAWSFSWALWGAERWLRGRPYGLRLTMAGSAIMVYSGHPVIAALYGVVLACYVLLGLTRASRTRRVGDAAVVLLGVAALTAAVTLPFLANLPQYATYKSSWDGGPYNPWWLLSDAASTVYLPMPVWALAVVGLAAPGERRRWFFVGLGAYGLVTMLPWFTGGPVRWVLSLGGNLVALYGQEALWLGVGWLAVRGVQRIGSPQPGGDHRTLRHLLYGAAAYYVVAWLASEYAFRPYMPLEHHALSAVELACLIGLVGAVAAKNERARRLTLSIPVLLLAAVPFLLPLRPASLFTPADLSRDPPQVVRAILAEGGALGRWRMSAEYLRRADGLADLTPNQAEEWGLWDIRTTNPMILSNFASFSQRWHGDLHFIARWLPNQSEELLRFLGVRWFLQDTARPEQPGWGWRTPCPLGVRDVEGAEPWVRAVGRWEALADPERLMSATFRAIENGDWRTKALLDRPPKEVPADGCGWSRPAIVWLREGPNRWRWRVSGPAPSLLVVLQNAHPNWSATLDGVRVPLFRAYGTFQAVEVPAGEHEVEMRYDEPWFWRGAVVSATAWLALLAATVVGLRRKRRGSWG
jgi:hypothetical protein